MGMREPASVECHVLTFKEGLLSPVAHDLKLRVEGIELKLDDTKIEATARANSLRVVCARKDNHDAPGTLSSSDKAKIEDNIRKDVLHAKRYPEIRFVSTQVKVEGDKAEITGELSLHGRSRKLSCTARRENGRWETRARIHQPDFGIKPYTALLGTLKVQPDVEIQICIEE